MASTKDTKHVVVIGAGLGGIAAAMALRDNLDWDNFTIFEKGDGVGGTWRDNNYPGCACDVPSHWYSLSSFPNPNWTQAYASQPEILAHLEHTAARHHLLPHLRFNSKVIDCTWNASTEEYDITVEHKVPPALPVAGTTPPASDSEPVIQHYKAAIVISAVGGLHVPNIPADLAAAGLQNFKGDWWHAAQWRHDVSLKGKRVGIVGTGASAVQIVPTISEDPTVEVVNFCRTPSWFVARINNPTSAWMRWMFAYIPLVLLFHRFWIYLKSDMVYPLWEKKWLRDYATKASTAYMTSKAPEHMLDKLIPKYEWGCKRVVRDPGYLESLHRPNVHVEWDAIAEIVEDGVKTATGTKHQLDVLVLATGFNLAATAPVHGTEGSLTEYFKLQGGPTAYRGTAVPTFPNFFLILGPNSASGHGSAVFVEEVQANYITKMIKPVLEGKIGSLRIKPEVSESYNDTLQLKIKKTVWSSCVSYYNQNVAGAKNVAIFPGSLTKYWRMMMFPVWSDYETTPGKEATARGTFHQ